MISSDKRGAVAEALTSTEKSPAAWPAATFLALSSKNAVVAALAWAASSASWKACTLPSCGSERHGLFSAAGI